MFLGQFSEERRLCKEAAAAHRYDKCNFIGLLEGAANGTMKKKKRITALDRKLKIRDRLRLNLIGHCRLTLTHQRLNTFYLFFFLQRRRTTWAPLQRLGFYLFINEIKFLLITIYSDGGCINSYFAPF